MESDSRPRIVMAPLLGITQRSFRMVFHRHYPTCDAAMAPFLATTTGNPPLAKRFRDLYPLADGLPLEPQLLGKEGKDFADGARRLRDDWGYQQVNWNIGCPSPTVTSRVRGAGLLPHPELIDRFLHEACNGFDGRISVKMRLGMEQPDEWQALVPILNRYPLATITIHGRTGRQAYTGQASVAGFQALAQELVAPVWYNGDIRSVEFALGLLHRCPGIRGLMIGRGLLADPELPGRIRHALAQRQTAAAAPDLAPWPVPLVLPETTRFRRFHNDLVEAYLVEERENSGHRHSGQLAMSRLKELWPYWIPLMGERGERLCARVLRSRSLEEYHLHAAAALDKLLT